MNCGSWRDCLESPRQNQLIAGVAQSVERLICNQRVTGSIPVASTIQASIHLTSAGTAQSVCNIMFQKVFLVVSPWKYVDKSNVAHVGSAAPQKYCVFS